jgi:hypothetical protein
MHVKLRNFIAAALCLCMFVPALSGCENAKTGETKIIRIGTHAQSEDDPTWVDSITGESNMDPDTKKAAEVALAKVEEELNVKIEFLQYSSDLTQLLLQTVLAGDPYCELAILWGGVQGTILSQNILQPLDEYADIFLDDPDGQWILPTKTFGHYYLMNRDLLYCNTWPIVYNISMIEAVPALKENGKTVYPSDLYYSGEWTWTRFKDYLSKIQSYYSGKKASTGNDIVPFNTNYTFFAQFALHSVGACIYDGESMKFDTEKGIKAAEYVDDLITSGVVSCSTASSRTTNSGWLTASTAFQNGETVFTNCARWRMGTASTILAERGESMGIIPFPYPDGTDQNSEDYALLSPMADSVGLLRGIDAETSRLALEAYKMYKVEYYKALAHVDSIEEYMKEQAGSNALTFGLDIFHSEVGDANLKIWQEFGAEPANEFSEAVGVMWTWSDILGKSIYGISGTPKYRIAIASNKQSIYDKLETISKAVNSKEAVDSVNPSIKRKDDAVFAFAAGTDPKKIKWENYITASDNIDGDYDIARVKIDYSNVDFNTVGTYDDALVTQVTDEGGNTGESKFTVLIYDKSNTSTPTLKLKTEEEEDDNVVSLNADTSTIDWGTYVSEAYDADGIDITSNITADVGWLDVTKKGTYPVDIVATDFAGNSVSATIQVTVK